MHYLKLVFAGCIIFVSLNSGYGQHGAHSDGAQNEEYDSISVETVKDHLVAPRLLVESFESSNRLFVVDQTGNNLYNKRWQKNKTAVSKYLLNSQHQE